MKQDMHDLKTKFKEALKPTETKEDNFYARIMDRIDYYDELERNYTTHILPKIEDIRNKSLDKRFHKRTNKPIVNNFKISDEAIQNNCLNILNNKITLIE